MGPILKSTLALVTALCVLALLAGLAENGAGLGLYYALLIFGSLLIPVAVLVTLYHFLLARRFLYLSRWKRFVAHTASVILISLAGLFIWAVLEHLFLEGPVPDFRAIWADFLVEYTRYIPTAAIMAVILPPAYHFFKSRQGMHPL